jgi:ribosomal protein S4E
MKSDKRQRRLLYRARATVPPGQWLEYRIGNAYPVHRANPGPHAQSNSVPLRFRFRFLLLSRPCVDC